MTIIFQGKEEESAATMLDEFLTQKGVDASKAIVEYAGEAYAPGSDLSAIPLQENSVIDVFRITAGG